MDALNLATVPIDGLTRYRGELDPEQVWRLDRALLVALGLEALAGGER